MWYNCEHLLWMFLVKYSSTFFYLIYCIFTANTTLKDSLVKHATHLFYWASLTLSSKHASQFVFSFDFEDCNNPLFFFFFFFSSFESSRFLHTWTFIRKQLRFWRFIQKTYYLCIWWRIILLPLCCKKIWNSTQRKTF